MGKSRCCAAAVWRVGDRRRRCAACRRTWRSWLKKRGRPRLRGNEQLLQKVFEERRSLVELAEQLGLTRQALSYRFLRALESRLARTCSAQPKPEGDLVLLIDGVWFKFKRRPWVLYLMAFKAPRIDKAVFIDPVLQAGSESRENWIRALETIPIQSRTRIRALVCDNFAGSTTIAKDNGWILQLCHFHLLASLRKRLGRRHPANVPALGPRQKGYELVRRALASDDAGSLSPMAHQLRELADNPTTPWKYGNILREFARRLPAYRAYRQHPELHLPRTTGSIESKARTIRDLLRQTRSLSTAKSLNLWVTNYLRLRPEIVCKAANQYTK